jgi:hypothetical protein
MPVAICIYCRKIASRPFNREHVIPRDFGKFERNLTIRCVCDDCNRYFGGELEWFLARDSGEALLRLHYGAKLKAGVLKNRRISLRIKQPGFFFGARVVVKSAPSGTGFEIELPLQMASRKRGEESWSWLDVAQLPDGDTLAQSLKASEIKVVGPTTESVNHLVERLKALGVPSMSQGRITQQDIATDTLAAEVRYRLDHVIQRALAKIAFNYLAWHQGPEFALRADFDEVRDYVRSGRNPAWHVVGRSPDYILMGDSAQSRVTDGHVIALGWEQSNDFLMVGLSLFNESTYWVQLCKRFSGVWRDLRSGHLFDISRHTVSQLKSVDWRLIRPVQRLPMRISPARTLPQR